MCAVDEILSHESDSVQERMLNLEKKVQQQDDEIVCLKSALADALRRLATLESGVSLSAITGRSRDAPGWAMAPPFCPPREFLLVGLE